jgi:hypothetical protein
MKSTICLMLVMICPAAAATTADQIIAENTRAIVYLQVEDPTGGVLDRGTGFIVSHDGYVLTAAHLKADPSQKMWAIIGQREGTKYPLVFRDSDETADVALWQLPQSASCRYAVTLSTYQVKVLDRVLVLGFPENDGLTPSRISINNLTSPRGFYKADGYLRPGNSGAPVFNETGQAVALVQGGTLPGTENNDLVPISPAISLLKKWGVRAGIDSAVPFDESCYASCRSPSHGIERWTSEEPWGPIDSGWVSGGHNRVDECKKLIAGALASLPGGQIDLLPGDQGMWETSQKDLFGHVDYKYFCKGVLRQGPIYIEKRSQACGLWN